MQAPRPAGESDVVDSMEFLAGHFTVLGFEFQNWMPIVVGAVAAYVVYLWKTGQL
jgi:hypothetical protein